jgi:hypothetical protein
MTAMATTLTATYRMNPLASSNIDSENDDPDAEGLQNDSGDITIGKSDRSAGNRNGIKPNQGSHSRGNNNVK